MILHQLIYAVGIMTLAYMLSETSLALAKKLEKANNAKFIIKLLVVIHFFSSLCSLFVGLFMHYSKEHTDQLQKTIEDLTKSQHDLKVKSEALSCENKQLHDQLYRETLRTEERSVEIGHKQGYVAGYSVGFEDCMDVLNVEEELKVSMIPMARSSGIHRIKTRPTIFDNQKAVEINGILR